MNMPPRVRSCKSHVLLTLGMIVQGTAYKVPMVWPAGTTWRSTTPPSKDN